MKCTQEILDVIREQIESIPFGSITITLNEKGRYVEISCERKKRIFKEDSEEPFHQG
jgi:hypothetical protein